MTVAESDEITRTLVAIEWLQIAARRDIRLCCRLRPLRGPTWSQSRHYRRTPTSARWVTAFDLPDQGGSDQTMSVELERGSLKCRKAYKLITTSVPNHR
jgi:hypothetical protein